MTTESKTPRCDSMQSGGHDLAYFARTLEREAAMLKEGLLDRMSLISSQEATITRLREALEAAGSSLSAVCGLLETYPRPSNDPNGRTLLDAREHSCAASRAARAALVQS